MPENVTLFSQQFALAFYRTLGALAPLSWLVCLWQLYLPYTAIILYDAVRVLQRALASDSYDSSFEKQLTIQGHLLNIVGKI